MRMFMKEPLVGISFSRGQTKWNEMQFLGDEIATMTKIQKRRVLKNMILVGKGFTAAESAINPWNKYLELNREGSVTVK